MNDPNDPTVTVCIPTFNRPDMLRASLQSVLWQSFRDIEVIVSDNASETDTVEVVESFGDPRVRIDRLDHNIGLFGNLSRCLHLGRGKYRIMLPDDDLMLPGNIESKVAVFETHPEVGLVHSGFRYINADSLPYGPATSWTGLEKETVQPGRQFIGQSIAQGGMTCVSSVMLRSDLVADEVFDADDGPYCDMALWLRVAWRADVGFLPAPLSGYRVHTGSASSGFRTHKKFLGRTVATMHHADALRLAHGRFVERPELDDETRADLRRLLEDSDRQMRLSVRVNQVLPAPVLGGLKKAMRWGLRAGGHTDSGRLYSALSLYSAYSPEPTDHTAVDTRR